jgi:hypothetical protein
LSQAIKGLRPLGWGGIPSWKNNYLCRCQDYSMIDGLFQNTRISRGWTPLPLAPSSEPKGEREKKMKHSKDDFKKTIIFANIKSMIWKAIFINSSNPKLLSSENEECKGRKVLAPHPFERAERRARKRNAPNATNRINRHHND